MKSFTKLIALSLAFLLRPTLAAPAQVTVVTITTETIFDYCKLNLAYCGWNLIKRGKLTLQFIFLTCHWP
jgi:hypothetical protein